MYLGTLGRMVELNCASQLSSTPEGRTVFSESLEGNVTAEWIPVGRRSWSMSLSGPPSPREVSDLLGFVRGHWGIGPFIFVSDEAAVTNMLSPAATDLTAYLAGSGLAAPIEAGPWQTVDGWAGNSLIKGTENALWLDSERSPVIPGRAVAASCYVAGVGSAVGISWYDAAGTWMGSVTGSTPAAGGRSHLTATPPAGAAACRVFVNAATTKLTRPALTLTSTLLEYSDGHGCHKALPTNLSRTAVMLTSDPGGQLSDIEFTIQEVG